MTSNDPDPGVVIGAVTAAVRRTAGQLTRHQRADLLVAIVGEVYDHVRTRDQEGTSLDDHDGGSERAELAMIVDAVLLYRHNLGPAIGDPQPLPSSSSFAPAVPGPAEASVDPSSMREHFEALWATDPTEAFQHAVNEPLDGDDAPIRMTARQAEKCLSILHAYVDDTTNVDGRQDSLWAAPARLVAHLLSARALSAASGGRWTVDVNDPWPEIDALPWPPPPGLRDRHRRP